MNENTTAALVVLAGCIYLGWQIGELTRTANRAGGLLDAGDALGRLLTPTATTRGR